MIEWVGHSPSWWYMIQQSPLHFAHPMSSARPAIETRMLTWLAWRYRVEGWSDTGLESPLLIVTKLEQYDYSGAAAIGTTMLAASLLIVLIGSRLRIASGLPRSESTGTR